MNKPLGVADLYALGYGEVLLAIRVIAMDLGYAIAMHGSMARDLDLVAVPWVVEAKSADELISKLRDDLGLHLSSHPEIDANGSPRAHGRRAWSFYFDAASAKDCDGPYIDISVMPRLESIVGAMPEAEELEAQ